MNRLEWRRAFLACRRAMSAKAAALRIVNSRPRFARSSTGCARISSRRTANRAAGISRARASPPRTATPTSIFIVGDRKQSIYGFRDADVSVVDDAADFIRALRPGGEPRQTITVSFRSAPGILAFVNDLFAEIVAVEGSSDRKDGFRYGEQDRFPVD